MEEEQKIASYTGGEEEQFKSKLYVLSDTDRVPCHA
jgi:hypothetical protein